MAPKSIREIRREISELDKKAKSLRKELAAQARSSKEVRVGDDTRKQVCHLLSEPRSFQQIMIGSGLDADVLYETLEDLYVAGKIRRWDLPRFVISGLGSGRMKDLLRETLKETPVRQGEGEKLTGLSRGQVSGVLIELQKKGVVEHLGPIKGDPWFIAKGTQEINRPPAAAPEPSPTEYRQRRRPKLDLVPEDTRPKRTRRPTRGPKPQP